MMNVKNSVYYNTDSHKTVILSKMLLMIVHDIISSSITGKATIKEEQVCKYMKELMD